MARKRKTNNPGNTDSSNPNTNSAPDPTIQNPSATSNPLRKNRRPNRQPKPDQNRRNPLHPLNAPSGPRNHNPLHPLDGPSAPKQSLPSLPSLPSRPKRPKRPSRRSARQDLDTVPPIDVLHPNAPVSIVLKVQQDSGLQVQGIIGDILTRDNHPRGVKVRLRDGRVGRVKAVVSEEIGLEGERIVGGPNAALDENGMRAGPPQKPIYGIKGDRKWDGRRNVYGGEVKVLKREAASLGDYMQVGGSLRSGMRFGDEKRMEEEMKRRMEEQERLKKSGEERGDAEAGENGKRRRSKRVLRKDEDMMEGMVRDTAGAFVLGEDLPPELQHSGRLYEYEEPEDTMEESEDESELVRQWLPIEVRGAAKFATDTVICPVCMEFEGDEDAVRHHVEAHFQQETGETEVGEAENEGGVAV